MGKQTPEFDISPRLTSHVVELTGLEACTKYYFEVISKDEVGNLATGGIYDFVTS